eukprot:SAG31_NODE_395_length_16265_cov_4.941420_12_plen_132_part_00
MQAWRRAAASARSGGRAYSAPASAPIVCRAAALPLIDAVQQQQQQQPWVLRLLLPAAKRERRAGPAAQPGPPAGGCLGTRCPRCTAGTSEAAGHTGAAAGCKLRGSLLVLLVNLVATVALRAPILMIELPE